MHGYQGMGEDRAKLCAGPILSARTDATSIQTLRDILEGRGSNMMPWVCDVRDIARGHVLGAEVCTTSTSHIRLHLHPSLPGLSVGSRPINVLHKSLSKWKQLYQNLASGIKNLIRAAFQPARRIQRRRTSAFLCLSDSRTLGSGSQIS